MDKFKLTFVYFFFIFTKMLHYSLRAETSFIFQKYGKRILTILVNNAEQGDKGKLLFFFDNTLYKLDNSIRKLIEKIGHNSFYTGMRMHVKI